MELTTENKLLEETSPYLLQHANNPVNWYPWGEQALSKAKKENKPILLSIGYSACHWCHVMAKESFEDPDTAKVMNELFINIKVDREERPDIDKIYQRSHQLLTQRNGGWPLTMFLNPEDQAPFFGGTYFPDKSRHGLPAFKNIIKKVNDFFHEKKQQLKQQNSELKQYFSESNHFIEQNTDALDLSPIKKCCEQLESQFDSVNGGFGSAPKFPHPTSIEFLLNQWCLDKKIASEESTTLSLVNRTLKSMALGGICDQLGGGFFRYSVDAEWMIPHFEKMLYDNGQLLNLYAVAWAATGNILYKTNASETGDWVIKEMQSLEGAFYSTLDADSEHIEGKYYYWNNKEVKALLTEVEFKVLSQVFGLNSTPNFEANWHFYVTDSLDAVANANGISLNMTETIVNSAKVKLLKHRELRIRPDRDEKIITSWNGLMIKGMAVAGKHLQRNDFIDSVERALSFIQKNLWVNGRLLATSKDGKSHLNAYLDDYIFLADGIMSLLEARWNSRNLHFVVELVEVILTYFSAENGGFYFTSNDHESLLFRPKPLTDEAIPAGNGVAVQVLVKLGHLLKDNRYLDAAEHTIKSAWNDIQNIPYAHCAMLTGTELFLNPPSVVIIRGGDKALKPWLRHVSLKYRPDRLVYAIPMDAELPGALESYQCPDEGVLAYVCDMGSCQAPIDSINIFEKL